MATEYATTEQLNDFMVMKGEIPNPMAASDERLVETVGTGDNTTTIFYLGHGNVIDATYTLYYGATAEASLSQPLTETTHYAIDLKLGKITLTTAGKDLVDTDKIYSAYSFNTIGFPDDELQDVLDRMEDYIDKKTSTHWANGSLATPNYNQLLDEKETGKGGYKRDYFTSQRPLPDVSTNLNGLIAIGVTTVTVDSTAGFPSSGYIGIGKEKITYSEKGATTFTVTATTIAHADGDEVLPFVVEASVTIEGSDPVWTVLEKDNEYDLNLYTGKIHLMTDDFNVTDAQAFNINPQLRTPNRFRSSYVWGHDEIPGDITQLTLMLAAKDLIHRAVRKAHSQGMNNFEPNMIDVDRFWIEDTIKSYKNMRAGSTI